MNDSTLCFPRLWLDRANECVHQGERPLRLTPKAFAVLSQLMEYPGRLATKDELMTAVWPDTAVTEGSLSTCIREIRRALEDDPTAPRYIQTVHRRGYRYLGAAGDSTPSIETCRADRSPRTLLVGRDRELGVLDRSLRRAEGGERRVIFLGGEAGIGKTTLVEHFIAHTAHGASAWVARGQCVEQYGACEAYLPWFDVLNHLAREYGPERLAALLRRCAPMWLAQLPWLIDAGERQRLQHEIAGVTRERMVRELAEALEALSAERAVVVVLEDLHWSDPSSIGLLSYLARRQRPARLLLLGTYRAAELHVTTHPLIGLKQELLCHRACEDLAIDFLTREAVAEYVTSRLPGAPSDLAVQVHQGTDGNPLFMVNVIDDLLARGAVVHEGGHWHLTETVQAAQTEVPNSLKDLIERQLDRLSQDDRRLLHAASVAGATFSAATVAAVLEDPLEVVEDRLRALARHGSFVRGAEHHVWPDGTQSEGYAFIHVLYQNVLYERMGATRQSRMHRLAGERLEAGYGDRAGEMAAELALHFQRGRDANRAVHYLAQAGESAIRRSAYVEAIALLNQGLGLLSMLPAGSERDARELQLRVPLGVAYINSRGYAAPEVGVTFERAHTLCRDVSDTARVFRVLRGMWLFAEQRADLRKARSVAEELLSVAGRGRDRAGLVEGHRIMGATWFHLGNFSCALDQLRKGLALYDVTRQSSHAYLYGQDPGVCCLAWQAWAQWYLGYPDQAVASATRAIELAHGIGHPFSLCYALNFAARLHLCRREPSAVDGYAGEAVRCAHEHGLPQMLAMAQVLHGWSGTCLGRGDAAIRELEEGVARWRSIGARLMTPYWMSLLASALDTAGRTEEALGVLNEGLAERHRSDERWFDCEVHILRASLTARARGTGHGDALAEVQEDLGRALREALERASPPLRLRAATAWSRMACGHGQAREAREVVRAAYAAFSEGFHTADLSEARAMLAEL